MATSTEEENICPYKKFKFPKIPVPKLHHSSVDAQRLLANDQPVLLKDTHLVRAATEKWELEYLQKHMGPANYTVYSSPTDYFKYFDEEKAKNSGGQEFEAPYKRLSMGFSEFVEKLKSWKQGDNRIYLQQPLNTTVGNAIVNDFRTFNWTWAERQKTQNKWGELTSNLLLVALGGNITPCHYDEQQNFFAQVRGRKRCLLFSPESFECLYPHPVWHPHDRQSQVDFENPDYERFPKFKEVLAHEVEVEPGDVLFIPKYWWHYVESPNNDEYTVSINFWYLAGPPSYQLPLKGYQKVAIMRNIEKMLIQTLQNNREVGSLMKTMVEGRYT